MESGATVGLGTNDRTGGHAAVRWKTIKIHLDFEGASPDTFGWPLYREFMEAFVPALAGMRGGPSASRILPGPVEAGSAMPVLRVPDDSTYALQRLRRGPTKDWTDRERQAAQGLYKFLTRRRITAGVAIRGDRPVPFRLPEPESAVAQYETLEAVVRSAGGLQGKVHLEFDEDGLRACDAGILLTYSAGRLLYHRVRVSGKSSRDARTGAILEFVLEQIEDLGPSAELSAASESPRTSLLAMFDDLADLLEEDFSGRETDDILSGVR